MSWRIVSRDSGACSSAVAVLEEGMAHGNGGGFRASPKGGSVLIRKVEPGCRGGVGERRECCVMSHKTYNVEPVADNVNRGCGC